MTRIRVQRGSGSSSSNQSRPSSSLVPQSSKVEGQEREVLQESSGLDKLIEQGDELVPESFQGIQINSGYGELSDVEKPGVDEDINCMKELELNDLGCSGLRSSQIVIGGLNPPLPPVPPPRPPTASNLSTRRTGLSGGNAGRVGSPRRQTGWPVVSTRSSSSGSRPSSPGSHVEGEGYNSADEQGPCFVSSYDDAEREHMFEIEIRRTKGLEVKRMLQDGNCLFHAVADQVYGDPEVHDMARQMCIDYMERERDHFSQFITEGFTSYCKRKRRDKVYGNNAEIQAFCEMYNRPIHIYCYGTEPINIFQGSYDTDTPPIRLSYHHGNHYNSLVDPHRMTIGSGLGFSTLRGTNIDKDRVKAAIKAQQDQQIDNALLAEVRFYSDLELTEKEMERMVIEASRAEYIAVGKLKQRLGFSESSTSGAVPSPSAARSSQVTEPPSLVLSSSSMQIALSMGFSYLQVIEAYSIFGDDVDSMVCYLLEMGGSSASPGSSRLKGKATE